MGRSGSGRHKARPSTLLAAAGSRSLACCGRRSCVPPCWLLRGLSPPLRGRAAAARVAGRGCPSIGLWGGVFGGEAFVVLSSCAYTCFFFYILASALSISLWPLHRSSSLRGRLPFSPFLQKQLQTRQNSRPASPRPFRSGGSGHRRDPESQTDAAATALAPGGSKTRRRRRPPQRRRRTGGAGSARTGRRRRCRRAMQGCVCVRDVGIWYVRRGEIRVAVTDTMGPTIVFPSIAAFPFPLSIFSPGAAAAGAPAPAAPPGRRRGRR